MIGGVRKSGVRLGKMLKLDIQVFESAGDHANGDFVTAEEKTAQHTGMIVGSLHAWRQVTEVTLVLDGVPAQAWKRAVFGASIYSRVEKSVGTMHRCLDGARAHTIQASYAALKRRSSTGPQAFAF